MNAKQLSLVYSFLLLLLILSACQNQKTTNQESPITAFDESEYITKGKAVASASFAALLGRLQAAMRDGGVPKAVEYCQLTANALMDSLSQVHQASIRRTSTRVRNPLNLPDASEQAILAQYQDSINTGGKISPIVKEVDQGRIAFYAPINVKAFCLQCHGKLGETLSKENYAVIKNRYPADKATGYREGDLRGMWSITFNRVLEQ
ncbi:MAG: DUF3365 domain-containing protein [Saprospiraceae bacterium]|nr:DUF3365 domain-containing protein [Saprospiraceae bacterium]